MRFLADLRVVLRGRDFRRLFAVRLTAQAADGLFQVALAAFVFFSPERHTDAASITAAFAVLLLPYSIAGPFAGVLLDRWRRRQVLVWANVLRAGVLVAVGAFIAADHAGPAFYLTALVALSVNRFILAGLGAALPHVVPRNELVMANAVSPTSGTIAALLGAGAGYFLREAAGGADAGARAHLVVLAAAIAGYLAAAAIATSMARDLLGPDFDSARPGARAAVRHVVLGMADAARHIRVRRTAAFGLGVIAAHRLWYGVITVMTIVLYRNYFHDPGDVDAGLAGLASVFAVSGAGFLSAALLTPPAVARLGVARWVTSLLLASSAAVLLPVAWTTRTAVLCGAYVLGVTAQGVKICVDAVVQDSVDDGYRGRVFSFYDVLFNVAFVGAAALGALVLPEDGWSPAVFVTVSAGYALTALASAHGHGVRLSPVGRSIRPGGGPLDPGGRPIRP